MIGVGQKAKRQTEIRENFSRPNPWRKLLAPFAKTISPLVLFASLASCASVSQCDPSLPADPRLTSLYEKFHVLDRQQSSTPLRILHLGDSHIAADNFSGDLAKLFHARFGDAGRGQFPAGEPFPYFRRQGFTISATDGWQTVNSLSPQATGLFGLSGVRTTSAASHDLIRLRADTPDGFGNIELDVLQQPGGGSFTLTLDGTPLGPFTTHGTSTRLMRVNLNGKTAQTILLSPNGDGPVSLLGMGSEKARAGVRYESHGIPGATLALMNKWDEAILSAQLSAMQPDVIILGYGTNEGFDDHLNMKAYRALMEEKIVFLESNAPKASILILGAFSGNRLPRWSQTAAWSQIKNIARKDLPCRPLELNERATYDILLQNQNMVLARWHEPPRLAQVRRVQKQLAQKNGLWYFDGQAVMGGPCGMHQWVQESPPRAYGDHVHLTSLGAQSMARAFWDQLIRPYESYACRQKATLSP
ncbi:MAG: lysophospholipase L1-like esterase [Parvibaculaceae bacterium]|jgi:lysophospholipase L1-like esterase